MKLIKAIRPNGVDMDVISTLRKIKIELGKYEIPLKDLSVDKDGKQPKTIYRDANDNLIFELKDHIFNIPKSTDDYVLNNCLRLYLKDRGINPSHRRNKFSINSTNYIAIRSIANLVRKKKLKLNEIIYYFVKNNNDDFNNYIIEITKKLLPYHTSDTLEFLAVYLKLRCIHYAGNLRFYHFNPIYKTSRTKPLDESLGILSEKGFKCETSITHLNQLMILLGKRMFKKKELDFSTALEFKYGQFKINSSFFDIQRSNNRRLYQP